MNYTRNDVIEVYRYLFPEPLEDGEYVCCNHGDPMGKKWNEERHVHTLNELLAWLDDRPDTPWNYGIKWQTKKLPAKQLNESYGIGDYPPYRAWAMIVDIEDEKNHVYMSKSDMLKKVWEKGYSSIPDWVTSGVDILAYTGGGLQAYCKFTEPLKGDTLLNMLYGGADAPGALCDTYKHAKNRWVDPGSFQPGHGQRLIGTAHPKHTSPQVITRIIERAHKGAPIDAAQFIADYRPRIEHINSLSNERAKKKAARIQSVGDNAFEIVKASIDMVDHFGLRRAKGSRGSKYTQVFCPCHDNTETPSASVTHSEAGDGDTLNCFGGCGYIGDVFDLYQRLNNGATQHDALVALAEVAGLSNVVAKCSAQPTKAEKKKREEIWDVAAWLTGNKGDLKRLEVFQTDKGLGMRIPFNIIGHERWLTVDWDSWNSPSLFRKAVMCQLLTSFEQYPKAPALIKFLESKLLEVGPGAVKDEGVATAIRESMASQFWGVVNSCTPLHPEHLHEWARAHNNYIPDDKPEWWEDASDFLLTGRTSVVLISDGVLYLRATGFLQRLRMEYGPEWNNKTMLNIIKKIGFSKHRRSHAQGIPRTPCWESPLERIERNLTL